MVTTFARSAGTSCKNIVGIVFLRLGQLELSAWVEATCTRKYIFGLEPLSPFESFLHNPNHRYPVRISFRSSIRNRSTVAIDKIVHTPIFPTMINTTDPEIDARQRSSFANLPTFTHYDIWWLYTTFDTRMISFVRFTGVFLSSLSTREVSDWFIAVLGCAQDDTQKRGAMERPGHRSSRARTSKRDRAVTGLEPDVPSRRRAIKEKFCFSANTKKKNSTRGRSGTKRAFGIATRERSRDRLRIHTTVKCSVGRRTSIA